MPRAPVKTTLHGHFGPLIVCFFFRPLTELNSSHRPEILLFEILISKRISMTLGENCPPVSLYAQHGAIELAFFFFMCYNII